MNDKYTVTCLWQDGSVTEVYDGKWKSLALVAGRKALEDGAECADLNLVFSGEIAETTEITPRK